MNFLNFWNKEKNPLLHQVIRKRKNVKIGQKLIKKGADVNYYNFDCLLDAPLHFACRLGETEWVAMLLYYGADPNLPSQYGRLPISEISSNISMESRFFLQNILKPYTCDNTYLSLLTLTALMREEETSLFEETLGNLHSFTFDDAEIKTFIQFITRISSLHLKLFIKRFEDIFEEITEILILNGFFNSLVEALSGKTIQDRINYLEIINFFLQKCCFSSLGYIESYVQISGNSRRYLEQSSIIAELIEAFGRSGLLNEEEITKLALLMVSFGMKITLYDFDAICRVYGFCELFEILLHMDTEDFKEEWTFKITGIVCLICDPLKNLEPCFQNNTSIFHFLDYFNNKKLKELCLLKLEDGAILTDMPIPNNSLEKLKKTVLEKMDNMSDISTLVELSRNLTRRHLIRRYGIKNRKEFYSVVNSLPIDRLTKDILILKKKLYD